MSTNKGIFLVNQRCCQKAYVKVWCRADEALVLADLQAALGEQGIATLRVRRSTDAALPLVTGYFKLAHGSADLPALARAIQTQNSA